MSIIAERVEKISEAIETQQAGFTEINSTYELMKASFQAAQKTSYQSEIIGKDIMRLGDTIMNRISGFIVKDKNWSTSQRSTIRTDEERKVKAEKHLDKQA